MIKHLNRYCVRVCMMRGVAPLFLRIDLSESLNNGDIRAVSIHIKSLFLGHAPFLVKYKKGYPEEKFYNTHKKAPLEHLERRAS